jgi:hypothetical protein
MLTFLIILTIWSVIGAVLGVPGPVVLYTDYEICGFSLKLALIIFLLGPFAWLSTIGALILFLLDIFSS